MFTGILQPTHLIILLVVALGLAMIWRGICEFYLAVFRIAGGGPPG